VFLVLEGVHPGNSLPGLKDFPIWEVLL